MPQKRNPDAAELVRAKPGRIIGALNGLLIVLKGLPLAYGKDMQEDKEGVFDAADSLGIAIAATTNVFDMLSLAAPLAAVVCGGLYHSCCECLPPLLRCYGVAATCDT